MKRLSKNSAFTMIEIMIVIIIIGALAALALPRFGVAVERVKFSEGVSILGTLLAAQKRHDLDDGVIDRVYRIGSGASNALQNGDLDVDIPASRNFDVPAIFDDINTVAQIARTTGEYNLWINDRGTIFCGDGGSNLCSKMGCHGGGGECN